MMIGGTTGTTTETGTTGTTGGRRTTDTRDRRDQRDQRDMIEIGTTEIDMIETGTTGTTTEIGTTRGIMTEDSGMTTEGTTTGIGGTTTIKVSRGRGMMEVEGTTLEEEEEEEEDGLKRRLGIGGPMEGMPAIGTMEEAETTVETGEYHRVLQGYTKVKGFVGHLKMVQSDKFVWEIVTSSTFVRPKLVPFHIFYVSNRLISLHLRFASLSH